MKSVIIFYPHIGEYGGIERNIIALADFVSSQGMSAILLCYYDHVGMDKFLSSLNVVLLEDSLNPFAKSQRLLKWFKVNSSSCIGNPLFFGAKAGFYGALAGMNNYVLHYTDPPSLLSDLSNRSVLKNLLLAPKKALSDRVMDKGVQFAKRCVTMTKWNSKELEFLYGRQFDVIYQGGVPSISTKKDLKKQDGTLRLFSICRISGSKNIDWILEATQYLLNNLIKLKKYQHIQVIIAGKGPKLDELKNKVEALNLTQYVNFVGFLDDNQVEEEYQLSDVFLVPARQGYGLPILEALYRRVPVVINEESRASEILSDNPWVGISANNSLSFSATLLDYIKKLDYDKLDINYLTNLPTEVKWASELGDYCGWWKI